ncbi:hypothetical protein Daus18300_011605 [Diaporthe australafricana]|uniref:Uncharacterized protein n=1 Tax=Diaporthe australafricana TaxID=127596 RepID=A0ABR3W6B1_9PEZI
MPTYAEHARALWQSLSPADKQRIHKILTIDGNVGWKFDKVAELCESHPEIPLALRAMTNTGNADKRKASPNQSSDECLARASQVLEHAETMARTIDNRFGEAVPEDIYGDIQGKLVGGRKLKGWNAVPVETLTQIIDLYAFNTTTTPPNTNEVPGEEVRQDNARKLWEAAKFWCAPRDCGRAQRLLARIERELPSSMKSIIKEENNLSKIAETAVGAFERDLESNGDKVDRVLRQMDYLTATNDPKIDYTAQASTMEDKLSRWDRTRRELCEKLQTHEMKAKYLRWGGRPLGRFDPFEDLGQALMDADDWSKWIVVNEQPLPEVESDGTFEVFLMLPAELRTYIWELALRDALNEAARSLPDFMAREFGFAAYGYHQFGCRCHPFRRYLRPLLTACKESKGAINHHIRLLTDKDSNGGE